MVGGPIDSDFSRSLEGWAVFRQFLVYFHGQPVGTIALHQRNLTMISRFRPLPIFVKTHSDPNQDDHFFLKRSVGTQTCSALLPRPDLPVFQG
ncbi:hypothetical protein R6Q59_004285 [Mikania micrantha]